MVVRLASDLELPDNAVTQTFAFLARKGAGKTYSAGKLTEGLLELGAPVIVLDPVGTWYGLRLSANGKGKGFDIPVFGGEHGDIPLEAHHGELLGQLVVEKNLSAVIDVSSFRKNERKTFVTAFAEALFHHSKKSRSPRMVVLEEAQLFAPQRSQGEERMLGAIEDIVRLGRNYGIGSTMISQRPQSINKEVLNQVECLFVGQLNASHERKAIEDWVLEHKAEKGWTKDLPSLPVGTMVVWSPQWLGVMKKVKILKKTTFDASATPELGTKQFKTQPLGTHDVEALRAALAPKPKEKSKAVRELAANDSEAQQQLELMRGQMAKERAALAQNLAAMAAELGNVAACIEGLIKNMKEHPALAEPITPKTFFLNERQELPPKQVRVKHVEGGRGPTTVKGGAMRMLQVLAAFYPGTMTKAQVAQAAKMTVTGGTFTTYWGQLKREGLLAEQSSGLFCSTAAGITALGAVYMPMPTDLEGRLDYWCQRLGGSEARMLKLIAEYTTAGIGITRTGLAEAMNMTASGGTFSTYVGRLVRNRLVAKDGDLLKIHPWLQGDE